MHTDGLRELELPGGAAADLRVTRKAGDYLLLVLTLAMVAWCVPLAIAYRYMPTGAPIDRWGDLWMTLALMIPCAVTALAVYHALLWVLKGTTPRQRKRWGTLLTIAFLASGPGYFVAFLIGFGIAAANHGIQ